MAKEKFAIEAGNINRPETVERGIIEKGTGQTITNGEKIQTLLRRADIGVPNWTEAWGVRLDKKGEVPAEPLNIKDANYQGQIKELKWNDPAGCLIVCRYLKGYNSIDKLYQREVLNSDLNLSEDTEASLEAFYLMMQSGDNYFDPESDRYLVQMLRIHYMNESSVYKNPNESGSCMFREKNEAEQEQKDTKGYSAKFDALAIVNSASKDNTLGQLKNLFTIVQSLGNDEPKDNDLYRYLSMLADNNPETFIGKVQEYKKEVSNLFEKAKSYNILDLTKDGNIAAGKDKIELIGSDIPAKKEGMLDWVLVNHLDTKASDIVFKLKQITDKLK